MASSCKSIAGCIEAHQPVRATYVNLYRWPESDAEFVRSLTMKKGCSKDDYNKCSTEYLPGEKRNYVSSPVVVDSFSCRQIYLRSYTFSKKETMPEKTVKCFARVRDKVSSLPFVNRNEEDHFDCNSNRTINSEKKKKKKRKRCMSTKNLGEAACNVVWLIFHRILACGASVDVVDR